jgi:membrane-associated phospholipid phosphatase
VWLLLLVCFVALAIRAGTDGILQADVSIELLVQDLPDLMFSFDNWLGGARPLGLAGLALAVWLLLRRCPEGAILVALTYIPRFSVDFIKELVSEPRPDANLVYVGYPHDNLSFPSGHVASLTLPFVLVFVFAPRMSGSSLVVAAIRLSCLLVVGSVGLARVWVGAHWPSDALAGYIYAALFLIPALAWARSWRLRRVKATADPESPGVGLPALQGP